MKKLKKIFLRTFIAFVGIYILTCGLLYFMQEKIIFFPKKLTQNYKFQFDGKFEELNIITADKIYLNGLLFKSDSSKGLIFYLHGNAGALDSWGDIAKTYTNLNYDMFILDYRGFGKSAGDISNEEQFYSDVQSAYIHLKSRYSENKIVIIGYSIGTGPASMLASKNNPKALLLQAPYFSLVDMMNKSYSFVPNFLLRYRFETFTFIEQIKVPIVIFHGNSDEVIYYGSSLKLQKYLKATDKLVTLNGQGHNGMNNNFEYQKELKNILNN